MNQTPEQIARDKIDRMLQQASWKVQDKKKINFNAGLGIAVREYPTDIGPADYVLFIDRCPCGVIEAKREEEGQRLTVHETQAEDYAQSQLKWVVDNKPLPFVYESTGILTRFTDTRDPKPRSREVFSFFKPDTLLESLDQELPLRGRLLKLPVLPEEGLRACQIRAINNLEASFKANRPRALIQMATGSGKTFTAITAIYRILKFSDAKRILFLVDTKNLGEQAEQEFMGYTPNDDNRKFTELYNIQRLSSRYIAPENQVCISTIQRMYSILQCEELDEAAEQTNPNEYRYSGKPKEVIYNAQIPPEFFDFIVIDECHRSIYNIWKQVLDYYDAFMIGLTATPDKRTFGFFNENVVSEYRHEEAVADGVNVGYDIYTIETEITKKGSCLKAKEYIERRHRLSRKKRWDQLDEEVTYHGKELDKDVVNPSQIRNLIRAFKEALSQIFPGRKEVPKTLIFAKTDSHADDIIKIVREEFNEGNDFCKKVTYQSDEDPKSILTSFRNDYNPRIAVTVDMIATGTDVKPLECLLFMRDVRSKNYFEQMKGRGTRVLQEDDLKKVTPSVRTNKTHFVIVDAVGVTKSIKTDSRPLERKPSIALKDLLMSVMMGSHDEDTLTSLASRLGRLNKELTEEQEHKFKELSGGKEISRVIKDLLNCDDPDVQESAARNKFKLPPETSPEESQLKKARKELTRQATSCFTGPLNEFIENARRINEQIIDSINIDTVTFSGFDTDAREEAQTLINDFKKFIETHKDEISALNIFYNQPYRRRELTYAMIKELLDVIIQTKPALAPSRIWSAYEQIEKVHGSSPANELTALVALIRHICGFDTTLTNYETTINRNFQQWVFAKQAGPIKFNEEQMQWLRMIKDHIATSFHVEKEDLDYAPFDSQGGLGKMYQLFGEDMETIINELNEALAA